MSDSLLLDTDVLVNVGRGDAVVTGRLNIIMDRGPVYVSAVTEMELIVGCRNKSELRNLTQFMKRFIVLSLTPEITAGSITLLKTYRLSHGLLIADALIAATALVTDRALVSGNAKHFSMIKGLRFSTM